MCVVCVFSQFAEDTNKERNMLIQITTSDSFFFKFLCLCITYFSPVPLPLSSPFEIQADTKKKKINAIQTCYYSPNFDPLIQSMLWLPRHSLSGWHVFHAWNEQFWPLTARLGHRLDTWNRLTGMHSSVFVVWPIESFVSGGGRLVFTAALNINVRESAQNKTKKKKERECLSHLF